MDSGADASDAVVVHLPDAAFAAASSSAPAPASLAGAPPPSQGGHSGFPPPPSSPLPPSAAAAAGLRRRAPVGDAGSAARADSGTLFSPDADAPSRGGPSGFPPAPTRHRALDMPPSSAVDRPDEDVENVRTEDERVAEDAARWRILHMRVRALWATPARKLLLALLALVIIFIAAAPRASTLPAEYRAAPAKLRAVEPRIVRDGDPRRKSVTLSSLELQRGVLDCGVALEALVAAMRESMRIEKYAGVAAAHLGVHVRACVVGERAMLNPRVLAALPETDVHNERSAFTPAAPALPVRRALHVRVAYQSEDGADHEAWLAARDARLVQHLVDVMDGITLQDRVAATAPN